MEDLQHRGIGEQRLEPRRVIGTLGELHEMAHAIAGRELHQAQPVAMRVQSHRLGVDGDGGAKVDAFRQIAAMKMGAHPGAHLRGIDMAGAQEKTRTSTTFRPLEPEI